MTQALYTAGTLLALAGLALAAWSLFIAGRARGRPRCPGKGPIRRGCWYDLSGSPADPEGVTTCPECGRRIAHRKDMLRTRRLWKPAGAGAAAVAAGLALAAWPMAREQDWRRGAPATVLVLIAAQDAELATDETWAELTRRARIGRLSGWQKRVLAGRLGRMLEGEEHTGSVLAICRSAIALRTFHPGLSLALADHLAPVSFLQDNARLDWSGNLYGVVMELIRAVVASRASAAIPALRSIAGNDQHLSREQAITALLMLGDSEAMDYARAVLSNPEPDRRWIDGMLVPTLALHDSVPAEAIQSLVSLQEIVTHRHDALSAGLVGAAIEAIEDPSLGVAAALGAKLRGDLPWWNTYLFLTWVEWLWLVDAHHGMIPHLWRLAKSDRAVDRGVAATLLGRVGAADRESICVLRALTNDPDPDVRAAAQAALEELR